MVALTKEELQRLLQDQITGINDYANGFKACASIVMDAFDKKEKENAPAAPAN